MGRVGFRGRTRRYAFLLVRARSGTTVDGATPHRRPACVIFGGFPRQLRHRVPDLSAYATKMRVPLLRANASAIVTREGGDGSPARGKSEPAPGVAP
jgi:hypothetical protein